MQAGGLSCGSLAAAMRILLLVLLISTGNAAAERKAKNVILFLADAGGIPTLQAASIHGYGEPRKLFVQSMPNIGLSDTSTASNWVTDSAAGMTAIVTGFKTHNGVVSQSAAAIRGKADGAPLKTILEYAEQRGLSTGVITNTAFYDATPAACYAQANDRRATATIVDRLLNPRFGDGVDVLLGAGRKAAIDAAQTAGVDLVDALGRKGYQVLDSAAALSRDSPRVAALLGTGRYELGPAVRTAIEILSRNPKGYFLMVEWDAHTTRLRAGLDNVVELDKTIRQTAQQVNARDTLIVFTADHSFDLRLVGGKRGEPLLPPEVAGHPAAVEKPPVKVDGSHSGEEVLVAAQGPGSSGVRGYLDNTRIFHIMMDAYGWKRDQ
jgi:alkaline phosphatase